MPSLADPPQWALPLEAQAHGCFETMRAYGGVIFRLEGHLDRLYASAADLGTRSPSDRAGFGRRLRATLARSGLREAIVRVALLPQAAGSSPSIVVQPVRPPPPSAYRRGIRVDVVPTRKLQPAAVDQQAKYSARLGSVLATLEAQLRGADEALWIDAMGSVTESTASNFWIVRDGTILTPPCWAGLLAGITRDVLFELAGPLRFPIDERPLTRHEVYNAQEAFLTSTIKEVLPVTVVDGRRIGSGRPGPIAQRLRAAFAACVRRECHGRRHGPK